MTDASVSKDPIEATLILENPVTSESLSSDFFGRERELNEDFVLYKPRTTSLFLGGFLLRIDPDIILDKGMIKVNPKHLVPGLESGVVRLDSELACKLRRD
jgi:hypothetical protein